MVKRLLPTVRSIFLAVPASAPLGRLRSKERKTSGKKTRSARGTEESFIEMVTASLEIK